MTTVVKFVDLEGGNDSNDGSTFVLRKKTIASAVSGLSSANDNTVKVMGSPDPTSMAQNATWTNGSDSVTLTTAVTANIDTCESAWTASANVTATAQSTTQREGTNAASLVIASAFTTGLVAYHALGGATDFSAYQQVSLLIRVNAALSAGVLTLTLCSDAAGVTAVNTIAIPALTSGYWCAVCVDTAGALGASIQSVALNALSDPGTITVFLDNIIACKASGSADSLTHESLIGKNSAGEPWCAIDSINGTTIKLGGGYQATASRSTFQPYYYGATATQTIYKRQPIIALAAMTASANGNNSDTPLKVECGWDRTAMTTQSGQTFVRLRDAGLILSFSYFYDAATSVFQWVNKLYLIGTGQAAGAFGFNHSNQLGEVGAIACSTGFYFNQGKTWALGNYYRGCIHCLNGVFYSSSGAPREIHLRWTQMWGVLKTNFQFSAILDHGTYNLDRLVVHNCDFQGHYNCFQGGTGGPGTFKEVFFKNCTVANQTYTCSTGGFDAYYDNCTIDPGVTVQNSSQMGNANSYQYNIGGDVTNHKVIFGQSAGNSVVVSDTAVRHTASDFSWKCTGVSNLDSKETMSFSIAKVACNANEQRTVKAWLRRDSINLVNRLTVKGDYYPGIDTDVTASMTAAINTWEQVTLQFTPTQDCVVEVFWQCYGDSTKNGWIDDLSVS